MDKKTIVFILLMLLAIGIFLILLGLAIYYFQARLPIKDYAIVFDAGSSGTRQYIYEWNADYSAKNPSASPLKIKQISSCNTDDNGIDKIGNKIDLSRKFSNCMREALYLIPEERRNRTKISLAATAGMRLLQVNSKAVSNEIFSFIRDYFRSTGFLFRNDSQVKVITGREEALDAWISANYFENNFDQDDDGGHDEASKDTKGIIDLGGASTQIVFVPKHPDPERTEVVRLFGHNYSTYSQSFLCYGLNEANLMYRSTLIKSNKYESSQRAYCYPRNSNIELTKLMLNKSPCANGFIYNQKMPYEALQKDYKFNGESNYELCAEEVKLLFSQKKPCQKEADACSFTDQFVADVKNSKFLAISSFWYAVEYTNRILNKRHDNDINEFKKATQQLCAMSYEQLADLNEKNRAGIEQRRLSEICFTNVYVLELLKKYGFMNLENIKVVDQVNGFSVGWTLGYLINELNRDNYYSEAESEDLPRKLSLVPFVLLASLLIAIILSLTVILVYYIISKHRRSNNNNNNNSNYSSASARTSTRANAV